MITEESDALYVAWDLSADPRQGILSVTLAFADGMEFQVHAWLVRPPQGWQVRVHIRGPGRGNEGLLIGHPEVPTDPTEDDLHVALARKTRDLLNVCAEERRRWL